MSNPAGRHFLQISGPTNVPDRVLRAMDRPAIDHRGPEFAALTPEILPNLKKVFQTAGDVVIYPDYGIKAVMVVHNETSTGATSRIGEIRQAIDRCAHPALFMVDVISSLGSIDYRHARRRDARYAPGASKSCA